MNRNSNRRTHSGLGFPIITVLLAACASAAPTTNGVLPGTAPALPGVETLIDDRLLFGQSIPGGGQVPDTGWTSFLRDVITPVFPAGLTVWHAEGQWLDPRGTLVREPVIVVQVFHPRGSPGDSVFARIANTYRSRFHQDAVLRATFEVQTRLYEGPGNH
ncbi:MAG: DUF3574 domain-containing protein [Gemmatimonadota bacterium]